MSDPPPPAPTSPGGDSLRLDPAAIERLRRLGGERLAARMLGIFVAHTPDRIRAARDGARSGTPGATEQAAHSLRSSCGQIGAVGMAALCARIEELAASERLDPVPELLDQLQREYEQFTRWALREIPSARSGA